MQVRSNRFVKVVGALMAATLVVAPAFAQHAGGGGGGGHAGGGGGHFAGGAHFGGGGHVAAAPHFGGARVGGYAAFHGAPVAHGWVGGPAYRGAYVGGRAYWGGYHPYWGGGYWHGYWWPRAYWGWGYPWFLAALPIGYATFWWSGVPYYYVNNVYYTWNPGYDGYVATDPPPVANGAAPPAGEEGAYPPAQGAPPPSGAPGVAGGADVYMYPQNGQTPEQQSQDRYECHRWAQDQSGFDPLQSGQNPANADSYHRAMVACLNARGYSAR